MRRSRILALRKKRKPLHPASASRATPLPLPAARENKITSPPQPKKSPNAASAQVQPKSGATASRKRRRPLHQLSAARPSSKPASVAETPAPGAEFYMVLFTKRSRKKHRCWDDALLIRRKRSFELRSLDNKTIVKRTLAGVAELGEGSELSVGNWDVEVSGSVSEDEFTSGRIFVSGHGSSANPSTPPALRRPTAKANRKKQRSQAKTLNLSAGIASRGLAARRDRRTAALLHSPEAKDALVLNKRHFHRVDEPGEKHRYEGQHPVVVPPILSRRLRVHQRRGIQFLYQAVMPDKGLQSDVPAVHGCILADDMGLGKTLQAIGLAWTLLKTGPSGRPTVKKVIVVCPATLVHNWSAEFLKWLGSERVTPLAVTGGADAHNQIQDFLNAPTRPVLIIGYELVRRFAETLRKVGPRALLVCDEGHRLKNINGNLTTRALRMLGCRKRVLLSGTPVQNNLLEFFSMCDFVSPGALGSAVAFRNTFQVPISRSRDVTCSKEDRELGDARSTELSRLTSPFVLRRTAELLRAYLPAKVEQVLFCRMTELQKTLYAAFLKSRLFSAREGDQQAASALQCITLLKKICNHPALVYEHCLAEAGLAGDPALCGMADTFPTGYGERAGPFADSGKLAALEMLLERITKRTEDKIVLVSNYQSALDILENLCRLAGYGTVRLDGATPASRRMEIVNRFNNSSSPDRVFLLSAKAGGVGLNLIGANRLVLFDPDWNPATDLQAMARVWRDGQTKTTWVYRMLTVGSIDEKIFQRQLSKQEVSLSVVDEEKDVCRHFKTEQIRELFVMNADTKCETLDFLRDASRGREASEDSAGWEFCEPENVKDALLGGLPNLSFIFRRNSKMIGGGRKASC